MTTRSFSDLVCEVMEKSFFSNAPCLRALIRGLLIMTPLSAQAQNAQPALRGR